MHLSRPSSRLSLGQARILVAEGQRRDQRKLRVIRSAAPVPKKTRVARTAKTAPHSSTHA